MIIINKIISIINRNQYDASCLKYKNNVLEKFYVTWIRHLLSNLCMWCVSCKLIITIKISIHSIRANTNISKFTSVT